MKSAIFATGSTSCPPKASAKVYIIDEAHMLTAQASNAFLKTLEEPPPHVIFILCTTEAHNILPTIISRCQRYDFRRLPGQVIYDRLAHITDSEAVAIEPDALRLVARHAGGSLRDAENLLEQLVVSSTDTIKVSTVEELLGLGRDEAYLALAQKLLAGDTPGALSAINEAVWEGADPRQMHRQTLELLRSALLGSWNAADTLDSTGRRAGRDPGYGAANRPVPHPARRSHLGRVQPALRCSRLAAAGGRRRRELDVRNLPPNQFHQRRRGRHRPTQPGVRRRSSVRHNSVRHRNARRQLRHRSNARHRNNAQRRNRPSNQPLADRRPVSPRLLAFRRRLPAACRDGGSRPSAS